jgi:hypothetical protein
VITHLTRENVDAFRKQSTLEEAWEPEPRPSERTSAVLKLTEGLGLIVAGIEVYEESDWKEQRASAAGQGIVRVFV